MLRMLRCCQTCSSDHISSRSRAMLESLLTLRLLHFSQWFICCCSVKIRGKIEASIVLHSSHVQSMGSVLVSKCVKAPDADMYRSPSSDHACIQKCRSDMKYRNSPLTLLPLPFPGVRSLIRHGFARAGFTVTFRKALLLLFRISILPLTVSFKLPLLISVAGS